MYAYDRYIVIHGCTVDCPWIIRYQKYGKDLASIGEKNREDSQTRSENTLGRSNLFNSIPDQIL